jgi:hypothetical protein
MTIQQLEQLQSALNQVQNLMGAQAQQAQAVGLPEMHAAPQLRAPTKESLLKAQSAIAEALKSLA